MNNLSGTVFRLVVLLIVFLLFSGKEVYAKKISRSTSPGSSSSSSDYEYEGETEEETVYQDKKYKKKISTFDKLKEKLKGKKKSEKTSLMTTT